MQNIVSTRLNHVAALGLGAVALFIVMYLFSNIFLILAVSLLFALLLDPLVRYIERQGFNRLSATVLVFGIIFIVAYFSFSFLIPKILEQLSSLGLIVKDLSLQEEVNQFENELRKVFRFLPEGVIAQQLEQLFSTSVEGFLAQSSRMLSNVFTVIALSVIVPFTTFFIVKDRAKILAGVLNILPNKYFEMSYWIIKKITNQLGRYVRGWILDATFVGFACGLSFYLIGIDNAIALGIIAGLGHLIPYLGPVIGGIPALFISVIQTGDFSAAPIIVVSVLLIYTLDNGIVQPYVFSKSVDMHPLIIILLIVAGSQILGLMGMLLAIPTATVLKTAAKEIYFAFKNYKIARL